MLLPRRSTFRKFFTSTTNRRQCYSKAVSLFSRFCLSLFKEVDVHDVVNIARSAECNWASFLVHHPVKFMRKVPSARPPPKKKVCSFSHPSPSGPLYPHMPRWLATAAQLANSILARLDVLTDSGSHSDVFLVPFTLPSRAAPSLRGEVAVKLARTRIHTHRPEGP